MNNHHMSLAQMRYFYRKAFQKTFAFLQEYHSTGCTRGSTIR
jgi:hypothetical protein